MLTFALLTLSLLALPLLALTLLPLSLLILSLLILSLLTAPVPAAFLRSRRLVFGWLSARGFVRRFSLCWSFASGPGSPLLAVGHRFPFWNRVSVDRQTPLGAVRRSLVSRIASRNPASRSRLSDCRLVLSRPRNRFRSPHRRPVRLLVLRRFGLPLVGLGIVYRRLVFGGFFRPVIFGFLVLLVGIVTTGRIRLVSFFLAVVVARRVVGRSFVRLLLFVARRGLRLVATLVRIRFLRGVLALVSLGGVLLAVVAPGRIVFHLSRSLRALFSRWRLSFAPPRHGFDRVDCSRSRPCSFAIGLEGARSFLGFFPFSLPASSPFCDDPSFFFDWSAVPGLSLALSAVFPCLFGDCLDSGLGCEELLEGDCWFEPFSGCCDLAPWL